MRAQRRAGLTLFAACAALAACGGSGSSAAEKVYRDPSQPLESRVEALLSVMSLEEKVEQMYGTPPNDGSGLSATAPNARLGIPGFRMVDGMRGVGAATGNATTFPVGSARGATFDPALEGQVAAAIGAEARSRGANVLLAPTINLLRHPRWGRAQETYGEDTFHVGAMAAAFVAGAQEQVITATKHFALYSIEDTRLTVNVQADDRTVREVYLPHFERAVEAGTGAVMSAYNRVNGAYCSENRPLLGEILDGDWGFDGFVVSDWTFGTRSTVPAAEAGLDVEMPAAHYYGLPLLQAVVGGALPLSDVDDAVRRVLRAKLRFGIFDGRPALDPALEIESAAHTALARQVEREAIVLLQNEGAALPIDRAATRQIAVVGALAATANTGDTGSSSTRSSYVVTPLAGIQALAGPSTTVVDLSRDVLAPADEAAVAASDVAVVVVGLTSADEGEAGLGAGDRKSLDLSPAHLALVADVASHNPRTVVVLEGSGALVVEPFVEIVPAILMAWYPGLEGGNALAEVLFGDVNPSGKLPVSFPVSEGQLPPFVNDQAQVTYGFLHGYRYLDTAAEDPRFPFGFGLSYTTFSFANLSLDRASAAPGATVHVSVEVTNEGPVAGDEVVELYASYPGSAVPRAVRELKGFARVSIDPGATATVGLDLPVNDLAYWDSTRGAFSVEPLTYTLSVGDSSRSLPLSASLAVPPG